MIDTTTTHPARRYNYLLGGTDNFPADRESGDELARLNPAIKIAARENRAFLQRAVGFLAGQGIRQFVDIGTGLPTADNTHEVAQRIAPESRIVYVDNDPLVLVHDLALHLSEPEGRCSYIDADFRDPDRILTSGGLTDTLDLSEPVAVSFNSVLMLLADADDPWAKVEHLLSRMPGGSYVVITHPTADFDPTAMAAAVEVTTRKKMTFVPRSHDQVAQFFGDWEMVAPGLVPILSWRPDDGEPDKPSSVYYWAGVARKT